MGNTITVFCEVCDIIVGSKMISNAEGTKKKYVRRTSRLNEGVYQLGKSVKYPGSNASFCSKECLNKLHKNLKPMVKKL